MSECDNFAKLTCKCGDTAGQHVPVGDHLGGCEACDGCVVFIAAVSPDPDPERVARWRAIGQEYALSQRTIDGLDPERVEQWRSQPRVDRERWETITGLGPGERVPTASTVERGTVGEERQSDRSAQPGSQGAVTEPNPLFEPAQKRKPSPAPRGGTPAAF